MKTLGLIGGTSWVSTADYYRLINKGINRRLGAGNSAKILLYSVNFEEFKPPDDPAQWAVLGDRLTGIARTLEKAGADCLVICANTPHVLADVITAGIGIPLIHIADETAKVIAAGKCSTVGLLGTKPTMERPFYRDRLSERRIMTIVPGEADREFIHRTILDEFVKDVFLPETKRRYLGIIETLRRSGAEGVILGCTEIPVLIKPEDSPIPTFDTTVIHAEAAVDFALAD